MSQIWLFVGYDSCKPVVGAVQGILNAVKQIWPVNGRVTVKSVIWKCVICYRMKTRTLQYPIAQLLTNRDKFEQPFLAVGADYCRPFYIKEKKQRNAKRLVAYAALFVCFSIKTIHIELVSALTSDGFLAALRRFFTRRGKFIDFYSDNTATFTEAYNELQITIATINSETNIHFRNYLLNNNIR
ncbi:uncharacterized protein LOC122571725 [Bombus pyrosoma]|uniref:uncharacterized protein LOC122571725 n=1 Tax=Bombus pyrosoma TaxID=396416 RepID=UPI001CB8BE9B|nr:uncharacterized protein LOC122571725 [Bombus pyrosoma]